MTDEEKETAIALRGWTKADGYWRHPDVTMGNVERLNGSNVLWCSCDEAYAIEYSSNPEERNEAKLSAETGFVSRAVQVAMRRARKH